MNPYALIFGLSVAIPAYAYAGYPLLLALRTARRKSPPRRHSPCNLPPLSLLIPVRDEADSIGAKLENSLRLDYPRDRYEVVVVSDGSTDQTDSIASSFLDRGVKLIRLESPRGKPAAINRALPLLSGELVVFTDATAIFEAGALLRLAEAFADPGVGAASGELILREEAEGEGEVRIDFYWRLEKFIRKSESRISSCAGATGAIYAVRRTLVRPLPEDSLLDDLLIPLEVLRNGYRVVFVEQARAWETRSTGIKNEFRRKVRTLAGNYQAFRRQPWSLFPGRSPIAFFLISHKLLRLFSPLLLLTALAASALGAGILLRSAFFAQILFYLAAALGWVRARAGKKPGRITAAPLAFTLLNLAALKAFLLAVILRRAPSW